MVFYALKFLRLIMSTFLTTQSLSVSYTSTSLFCDIDLNICRYDRIGLIGHNGCGKSTLLKVLSQQQEAHSGTIAQAHHCVLAYVEQTLPIELAQTTLLQALTAIVGQEQQWQAEQLLTELGFTQPDWQLRIEFLSGGQQMRLLLARAIIHQPDLLLLDEPSNHLDLPALLWLEDFLARWQGAFVLVSHDQRLLDRITQSTWIMRDQKLYHFDLPCSEARKALAKRDEQDRQRHHSEQKEIARIEQSAKRLAQWGKLYDNEDLARKAKTMFQRKARLEEQQTELGQEHPWVLSLHGEVLRANRLLAIEALSVSPPQCDHVLFEVTNQVIKSGDRIAILGANGCGKSTLLTCLLAQYHRKTTAQDSSDVIFHEQCRLGYYDQSLQQLNDHDTLADALHRFGSITNEEIKKALISAGFAYQRHSERVASLSGGERSRLLFIGLSLASYHLLLLDEPTNHLDLEGKEELIATLNQYQGGALIVSHDRELIEQSCQRFWVIDKGELKEYLEPKAAYQVLSDSFDNEAPSHEFKPVLGHSSPQLLGERDEQSELTQDQLLEQLIELETLLNEDLCRKVKHQKLRLQDKWRQAIADIEQRLES